MFLLASEAWGRSDSAVVSGRNPPSLTEPEPGKLCLSFGSHRSLMLLWCQTGARRTGMGCGNRRNEGRSKKKPGSTEQKKKITPIPESQNTRGSRQGRRRSVRSATASNISCLFPISVAPPATTRWLLRSGVEATKLSGCLMERFTRLTQCCPKAQAS